MTMMQMLLMATSSLTPLPDAYLDLDFASNSYRLADAASSYDAAFLGSSPKLTYATTSNSTMVDSSGDIVWAPHNLVDYSEDFSQWSASGITLTSSTATDPLGGSTASTYSGFSSGTNSRLTEVFTAARNFKCTLAIWLKGTAGETIELELDTDGAAENEITFTGSWQLETISNDNPTTGRVRIIYRTGNTADVVSVWGAHIYRSDLGGMAPVPGAATGFETYVPTNGAVEYLPRVGHHVYNGSTWVNEGLLLESEARTNLLTYSEDQSQGTTTDDATLSGSTLTATVQSGNQFPELNRNLTVSTGTTTWWADIENLTNVSYVTMATQLFDAGANGTSVFELGATPNVATENANHTATITEVEPGVYRCSVTFTTDGTDNVGKLALGMSDLSGQQRVTDPDGTESMDIVRQQLEVGSTPSSYMPSNATAQGSRAAQTLTVPSSELGWDSSAVSLQMEGRITASDDAGDIMTLSQWKQTNNIRIDTKVRWNGAYQGNVQILAYNGSSPYSAFEGVGSHSVSDGVLSPYSIAWRHTSSTLQAASSGSAISNTGTPNNGVPDLSAADITIGTDFMGTIRQFRQWNEDIGETGIEEATS